LQKILQKALHYKNISLRICFIFFSETATRFINAIFPPRCLKCSCSIIRISESFKKDTGYKQYPVSKKYLTYKKRIQHNFILKEKTFLRTDEQVMTALFSDFFCYNCINETDFIPFKPPFCIKCGKQFKDQAKGNHLCRECIEIRIGKVRACGIYQGILRESIHLFKYRGKTGLALPLELMLFRAFEKYFSLDNIDFIMPVPLHRAKLAKRGFNQSFLLIKDFRRLWKLTAGIYPQWKIDYTLLTRTKNTKSQTGFDKNDRKKNIKGAFKVMKPDKIKNKYIILVDDVYTTGSTVGESASVLLDAGALSVDVLVLARV